MINIEKLIKSGFFYRSELKASEVLFDEGNIDTYLYIVEGGKVVIQKYIDSKKKEVKDLAVLSKGAIFGEGSLANTNPKEVRVVALTKVKLVKIDTSIDFALYIKEYPNDGIELLSNIIDATNKRLLESNFLVTSNYSIVKYISEISEFNNKNLFLIIDKFLDILKAEFIIYIEKSPVIDDTFILRYNTREKGRMQEIVGNFKGEFDSEEFGLGHHQNLFIEDLRIGNEVIGYVLIGGKEKFSDAQVKSIGTVSVAIAGYVKQKQAKEALIDLEYFEI